MGEIAVHHLPRKEPGAVGRLDQQAATRLQGGIHGRRQAQQLVAREVFQHVDGDDRRVCARTLFEQVERVARLDLGAAPSGKLDLLFGDVDASSVRESTPFEIRQQTAVAAAQLQDGRVAIDGPSAAAGTCGPTT